VSGTFRFGVFELDIEHGELRKSGTLIKLTNLPFQVLACLVANAGDVVIREELQRRIWGDGTFVDFDRNLNVAVAQIRSALHDDAESPRFIQTVPRRGYRFIAPVERIAGPEVPETERVAPPVAMPPSSRIGFRIASLAVAALLGALLMALADRTIRETSGEDKSRPRIATLPFETRNGVDEDFLDGLTDELITQLGSLHPDRLGVIARSSVMRYKQRHAPIDQIRQELSVDYVLEGSARREGEALRITVRLISTRDQSQIWTTVVDHKPGSALAAEEQLASRIAAGVTAHLFPNVAVRARSNPVRNPEAWVEYRQGRLLLHQGGRHAAERAVERFQKALKHDPQFAEAAAALAESYVTLGRSGGRPSDTFPKASEAARQALALDASKEHRAKRSLLRAADEEVFHSLAPCSAALCASSSEAHNALANALFWHDWKWRDSELHFREAIRLNPSNAAAHHDYAWLQVAGRRTEDGLISLRRALELDPLSRRVNVDAGWLLLQARRYEESAEQARRALEIEPGMREAMFCLSRALTFQERYGEARDELLRVLSDEDLKKDMAGLAPEAAIRHFYEALAQRPAGLGETSRVLAWLGRKEQALEALERAFQEKSSTIPLLATEPSFDVLRDEPRFRDLLRRAGL
jgi:DNA-binding winged helix-turn-helix (wHTH) protein/TolB-like protein/tetratricopeptide (TPR) repeat protein